MEHWSPGVFNVVPFHASEFFGPETTILIMQMQHCSKIVFKITLICNIKFRHLYKISHFTS